MLLLVAACAPTHTLPPPIVDPPSLASVTNELPAEAAEPPPPGDAAALPVVEASPARPKPALVVAGKWLPIHERPDRRSLRVGLARRGQRVPLISGSQETAPVTPCRGGWYAVAPRGFACAGDDATLEPDRAAGAASLLLPDASRSLPFRVGAASFGPRYRRPPSEAEQADSEPDLARLVRAARAESPLVDVESLAALRGAERRLLHARGTYAGQRLAWAREVDVGDRAFLVTPDGALVPKDRVTPLVEPRPFSVDLGAPGAPTLPIAFVVTDDARRFELEDGVLVEREPLARRAVVEVEGAPTALRGARVLAVRRGGWVRLADVAWVERPAAVPRGVSSDARWVRASVTRGTLLAMRGLEPVRAFAMSPGAGGVGKDVKHGTPLGRFMVSWKHLTADMSGEEGGVGWSVDEVPWVAYYVDGYAVHGAYWHDGFGRPRSHGCLNLAPADARWLFEWMDPQLPDGWYAVAAHPTLRPATVIDVAP